MPILASWGVVVLAHDTHINWIHTVSQKLTSPLITLERGFGDTLRQGPALGHRAANLWSLPHFGSETDLLSGHLNGGRVAEAHNIN